MSIPGRALFLRPGQTALLEPDDAGRPRRLQDFERGGIALNDPSAGLDVANWRARLVGNEVLIGKEPYASESLLITEVGITELSLSFDQNMRPMLAYVANSVPKLWWFDTLAGAQVTTALDVDTKSPYLTHDDKRALAVNGGTSDVLLLYIRGNRLCCREQRERFTVEHTLRWFAGNAVTIRRAGMNKALKLQVELVGLKNRVLARPYVAGWTPATFTSAAGSIAGALPAQLAAGDLVFAALMRRGTVTPPAGWTLVREVGFTNGTAQTLALWQKDSVAAGDSGAALVFNQVGTAPLGLSTFAVRSEQGALSLLQHDSAAVNSTATNAIAPPALAATLLAGELHMAIASTVNAQAAVTTPSTPPGMSLIAGTASLSRLAIAYQLRDQGQAIGGSFTFDNGSPISNGLGAIAMRFGAP